MREGADATRPRKEDEFLGVTRYWRYSRERMERLYKEGRIIQPGAVPQYKRYLDEMPGVPVQNMWTDISVINNRSKEALGYPTQKPEDLLRRILNASSNKDDLILDCFVGSGTTSAVAEKLGRRWIASDLGRFCDSTLANQRGVLREIRVGPRFSRNRLKGAPHNDWTLAA
jgi:hypothetical protein